MKLSIIIILTLVFISCKQNEEKKPSSETIQQEVSSEESHKSIDGVVSLDNGKLWQANPETTTGINNMKKRMQSFTEIENIEAYSTLKEGLESDFTELFEKCTMTGEAHHQLHNYLFPFIDLFDDLSSSELNTCKKSFNELKAHLNEYSTYFE